MCGSPSDQFEPYQEAPLPEVAKPASRQWRCLICGFVHDGSGPPGACPVCGAHAGEFEPDSGEGSAQTAVEQPRKVLVLGAGIAGLSAVESMRASAPESEIVLISKETELPYYRLNLTRLLAGEVDEATLPVHPEAWYEDRRIRLVRGVEAQGVAPDRHEVSLSDGSTEGYDRLVITCGSHPFVPAVPGAYREDVTAIRTLHDVRWLLATVKPGMRCVCIGGGILGLETAGGLANRGADVTILESYKWLLPRQLNEDAGRMLEAYVAARGIRVVREAKSVEIVGDERTRGVLLSDGTVVSADLVVFSTGVRPNSYLARMAGLKVNNGIVVDARLATTHPDIYAAGDVAEHAGTVYGQWEPARYQGTIAGMNAAGLSSEFGGLPRAATLKVLGIDLFSLGVTDPPDGSYEVISARTDAHYHRFVFHDSRLVGAVMVGDSHVAAAAQKAVKSGADFSAVLTRTPTVSDIISYLQ